TPNADFNGTDLVIVQICDAGTPAPSICVDDTIFITVNGINDAPVTANENAATNEDTPLSSTLFTAGDFDTDSTILSANTTHVVDAVNGTILINANGTYTYTPNTNF